MKRSPVRDVRDSFYIMSANFEHMFHNKALKRDSSGLKA